MNSSNWIAYVGPFSFPDGRADSRRVYGISCSLVDAGYRVLVGSGEDTPLQVTKLDRPAAQEKLDHIGLGEFPRDKAPRLEKGLRWLVTLGERTVRWLNRQEEKPSHVFLYHGYTPFALRLLSWCRHNGVPLIVDVVEWYDGAHLPGGRLGAFNWNVNFALRFLYPKCDGVIVISSFLEKYFCSRGSRVLRIPPTIDLLECIARTGPYPEPQRPLTLTYAGIPGRKDLIGNVVETVLQFERAGRAIRLILVGPDSDDILRLPQIRSLGLDALPASVEAIGPQSHDMALELLRNADFMPLLRPPQRYAQAGFPTKVVESLAVGTPVICNLTSDLGKYIQDGQEGFVCQNQSVEAFSAALERALTLSSAKRAEMRAAARLRAERSFDYRSYSEALAKFLKEILLHG